MILEMVFTLGHRLSNSCNRTSGTVLSKLQEFL